MFVANRLLPQHCPGLLVALLIATPLLYGRPARAQSWTEAGPTVVRNGQSINVTPNNEINGAINRVLPNPLNADVVYLATVNGGVWRTSNATAARPNWTPLTDRLPSLAAADVEFDPADPSMQTLVAGFGRFSSFGRAGGPLAGVYRSTDGGTNWTAANGTAGTLMTGRNLYGVLARGATLLASNDSQGLYRTTDTGATWARVSGGGVGLPSERTFDLAGNAAGSLLYVGSNSGVYRSVDGGANWTLANSAEMTTTFNAGIANVKLALGPVTASGQTLFAGVIRSAGTLAGLYRSPDGGATWTALDTTFGGAITQNGAQGSLHVSMAADPSNANVVYVGGDRIAASPFTAALMRVDASLSAGAQGSTLTNADTSNNSTPHADTRALAFAPNGTLLMGGDGGVYRRSGAPAGATTIGPGTGQWTSIANDLRAVEVHSIAYDRIANAVLVGTQDNASHTMLAGVSIATPLASQQWTTVGSGDGGDVAVDPLQSGSGAAATASIRFTSAQNFGGPVRRTYDSTNTQTTSAGLALRVTNAGNQALGAYLTAQGDSFQFRTPIAVNAVEGGRAYVGTNARVFESLNRGDDLTDLVPAGLGGAVVTILAGGREGTTARPNVLFVGAGAKLWGRSAAALSLTAATTLTAYGTATSNMTVRDLTTDNDDWHALYVIGSNRVFQGAVGDDLSSNWTNITSNLATLETAVDGAVNLRAIKFVPLAGAPAGGMLIAGGAHGLFRSYADDPGHLWSTFPQVDALPNGYVSRMDYDVDDDVLSVGFLGRGAWVLPNASVYLATLPEPSGLLIVALAAALVATGRRRSRRR